MNIIITGGTGFIGSRLALKCASDGHRVKVLGLENTPAESYNKTLLEENGVAVEPVKVTDFEQLLVQMQDIDVVYHLAAAQHEMNIPDSVFWEVNVEGTKNILEASIAKQVKKVVHGSTIGVYGIVNGPVDEKTPCKPENIYGKTKYEGEQLALSYSEKIPLTVVRIPEVYGPGDRRLLKLFKMVKTGRFFMIGDGKNLHHLIYVDDLIEGLLESAQTGASDGDTLLLAGPRPISTAEMVDAIAKSYDRDAKYIRFPFWPFYALATVLELALRPIKVQPPLHRRRMDFFKKSFTLSFEKAKRVTGFEPCVDFYDGARETSKWYEENGLI
jgi:nucleoside-diphosphate-sugar epimerase